MANELFAALWALAALCCLAASLWFTVKFFQNSHPAKRGRRFRDAAGGAALLGAVVVCVTLSVSNFKYGLAGVAAALPMVLCLGVLALPIGIAGMYWRSYQSDLFSRYPNVVGTPPLSARPGLSEQSQSARLPGTAERAGLTPIFSATLNVSISPAGDTDETEELHRRADHSCPARG